jgi:hypothetical protein
MANKKRRTTAAATEIPEVSQAEGFVDRTPPVSAEGGLSNARITLPLTEAGAIDWEAARDGTSEQFTAAVLNDPITLEMIGLAAEQTEGAVPPASGWQPQQAGFALDILGSLEALILSRISPKVLHFKIEDEVAQAAFKLDEADHAMLDAPGARLMNKYITIAEGWEDEAMFLTALGYVITKQTRLAVAMQVKKNEEDGVVIEQPYSPPPKANGAAEAVKH